MCMCATALFLLPVWNLLSPLCSLTPISWRGNSGDLRTLQAEIGIYKLKLSLHGFSGPFGPKWQFWGAKLGKGWYDIDPQWTRSSFGHCYFFATFGGNRSRSANVRVQTDRHRHTHWQTQTEFIICPMLYAIAMGQVIMLQHTHWWYKVRDMCIVYNINFSVAAALFLLKLLAAVARNIGSSIA